ncbi:hypothetical protein [Parvularcula lutaonensis]|uniref:Uncharacterized protein n=1 Tax=Parvularcula lutaonensis TaxID=491923 RepID=A0ABV7M9L2_9PROT|nr:hypothetical protein [Parvularcula lutaonensis]GGY42459.1 hypothetical protein GCM10007148_08890 [Parvularcula lutaonensis]
MTSEVVLMNRSAVAMAADSAVTISGANYLKTYQSVDKLFPLVEGQPIGVMIYNNAELMSTPWETIISLYREQARGRALDTLDAHARDFIAFLSDNPELFPQDHQDTEFFKHVAVIFSIIAEDFDFQLEQLKQAQAGRIRDHVSAVFAYVVEELYGDLTRNLDGTPRGRLEVFPEGTEEQLLRRYGAEIDELIASLVNALKNEFPTLSVANDTIAKLRDIAVMSVTQDAFFEHYTGVVFAGFGRTEKFPSMRSYLTSSVVLGKMKNRMDRAQDMSADSGPVIAPFAQDRMIRTFLTGMDAHLRMFLFGETLKLSSHLVADVIGRAPGMNDQQRAQLMQDYSEGNLANALKAFFTSIDQFQYHVHTMPILRAVSVLPKKELGETAASLIKLNSFQQKVMNSVETVGGPISLATITRNEGLVMGKEKAEL